MSEIHANVAHRKRTLSLFAVIFIVVIVNFQLPDEEAMKRLNAFQPNFALSISSQGIQFERSYNHPIGDIYNCQSENLMTIFQIDLQNHYAN